MNLRWKLVGGSAAAAAVSSVAVAVATEQMLIAPDDRNTMLGVILGGFVLAVFVASMLGRRLIADMEQLAEAASRVGEGDLEARSGVARADELGTTARAFDDMVCRLSDAEGRRQSEEEERRLLFASISHDLRTPLAAITAALEAIEDGVGDSTRLLTSAQCDVRALSGLVDDLFLLAQLGAGRYEPSTAVIDLAEVVDEAVESLLPTAAAAGVDLHVSSAGRRQVLGSERELGRVVRNLLDNAIRHSPASSRVTIAVRATSPVAARGPCAAVHVIDQGPGFSPDLVTSATDPFVRGDPARTRATGGAGLGLSIASGVVAAHGGVLILYPGPGGRVEVELPLIAAGAPAGD